MKAPLLLAALLVVCVACDPSPPAPQAVERPVERRFDVWQDGFKLYHPDGEGGLVEVSSIDRVPDMWRAAVVVIFEEDGLSADARRYVADVTGIYEGELVARLMSPQELAARIELASGVADAAPVDAPAEVGPAEVPRGRAPARRAAQAKPPAEAPAAGLVIEGISRLPDAPQARGASLPAGDTARFALKPAQRSAAQREVFDEINGARQRGDRCGGAREPGVVGPLLEQSTLSRVAQELAQDMARTGRTAREDDELRALVKGAGYGGRSFGITTEGVSTGREFASKYVESPGWCVELMKGSLKSLGFGVARSPSGFYWVMIAGDR